MKIGEAIISEIIKDKEVISATIVGSYSDTKNIENIGDLDVVIICKKLTKKNYLKINSRIKKIKFGIKTLINPTFGPMKIGCQNSLPIHLMIYDVKSHIQHVLKSPFTCFDWERSKIYRGKSLKNIYSVKQLQLNDFINARRNSNEYLKDIKKNRISIRSYKFQGKKVLLGKKYVRIDQRNRGEFVYHIINFLIINLYKFLNDKNIKVKDKNFDNLFLKISNNNKKLLKQFKILREKKKSKAIYYDKKTLNLALVFIQYFNNYIKNLKKEFLEINFVRHAETSFNKKEFFLGSRNNPDIIENKKKKISNSRFNCIITSNLLRSRMTSKLYYSKRNLVSKLITEIDYGKVDGLTVKKAKKQYPNLFKSWKKGIDVKFPNGENTRDVIQRVKKFIILLKKFKKGEKILIISHSYFIRVFFAFVLKLDQKKAYKIKVDHLKIFQFLLKGNKFTSNFNRADYYNILTQTYD